MNVINEVTNKLTQAQEEDPKGTQLRVAGDREDEGEEDIDELQVVMPQRNRTGS